jgi:quercetin dioxygenase-like cupin family protein
MIDVAHHFSDGLYAKQVIMGKGDRVMKHTHSYSHLSVIAFGCVDVICDGSRSRHWAGECLEIKAGLAHEIVAVEDSVWFCIHQTDEKDHEKVDKVLVEKA